MVKNKKEILQRLIGKEVAISYDAGNLCIGQYNGRYGYVIIDVGEELLEVKQLKYSGGGVTDYSRYYSISHIAIIDKF